MVGWREELRLSYNDADAAAVRAAIEQSAPAASLRRARLVSFAELERDARRCGGSLEEDPCWLLIGSLGAAIEAATPLRSASGREPSPGVLRLTDRAGASLCCSVSAEAAPPPDLRGRLVFVTAWRFVPATPAAASHLEVDGRWVDCSRMHSDEIPAGRPRKAYGDSLARPLSAVAGVIAKQLGRLPYTPRFKRPREGDDVGSQQQQQAAAVAKLLHVTGHVRAVSELVRLSAWPHSGGSSASSSYDRSCSGSFERSEGTARGGAAGADDAFFLLEIVSVRGGLSFINSIYLSISLSIYLAIFIFTYIRRTLSAFGSR